MGARNERTSLITDAHESLDDEFDRRRRKYAIMMGLRAICVVAAAATYQVSVFLALAFIVGGAVLPWCAVLIANDGPPKRRARRQPYVAPPSEHTLPAGRDARVIDA